LNIREKKYFPKIWWNLLKSCQHIFVGEVIRNRWHVCQHFFQKFLAILGKTHSKPFPPMVNDMEQNLEKPCPTVRPWFKAVKRLPALQVGFLDQVLSLRTVADHPYRCPVEIVEVWQGAGLEVFKLGLLP